MAKVTWLEFLESESLPEGDTENRILSWKESLELYFGMSIEGCTTLDEIFNEFRKLPSTPKKWEKTYTLESVTDFYSDDDFEDALTELFGEDADLSEEVTITLTRRVK